MLHGRGKCELYCDGFESLKGVLGGRPYLILWYPVVTEDDALEALARSVMGKVPPPMEQLRRYCEEFIRAARGSWLCMPYFKDDPDFSEVPTEHLTKYKRADEADALHSQDGDPSETVSPVPEASKAAAEA